MLELGNCWANRLHSGAVVFLSGDLGVGKTTLARGILQGMGYRGTVNSPTYTLVESYQLPHGIVHHFDLYRLKTPSELEMIGLRDMLDGSAILLIEWPERGNEYIPEPHFQIGIQHRDHGRRIEISTVDRVN